MKCFRLAPVGGQRALEHYVLGLEVAMYGHVRVPIGRKRFLLLRGSPKRAPHAGCMCPGVCPGVCWSDQLHATATYREYLGIVWQGLIGTLGTSTSWRVQVRHRLSELPQNGLGLELP